jgi:hypothetical protein
MGRFLSLSYTVSMIFDLSIMGRNGMDGARPIYESPHSKHQTGAPPRGWGLRRRNREPTHRVGVRRTNLKD